VEGASHWRTRPSFSYHSRSDDAEARSPVLLAGSSLSCGSCTRFRINTCVSRAPRASRAAHPGRAARYAASIGMLEDVPAVNRKRNKILVQQIGSTLWTEGWNCCSSVLADSGSVGAFGEVGDPHSGS
jgi:hypothetical protein